MNHEQLIDYLSEYRYYTIWRVSSPLSDETAIIAHVSHPDDKNYQHEYQEIIAEVRAKTAIEAREIYEASKLSLSSTKRL